MKVDILKNIIGSRPPSKDSGKDGEPPTGRAGTAGGKNPKSKSKKGKDNSPVHSRPGSSLVQFIYLGIYIDDNLSFTGRAFIPIVHVCSLCHFEITAL